MWRVLARRAAARAAPRRALQLHDWRALRDPLHPSTRALLVEERDHEQRLAAQMGLQQGVLDRFGALIDLLEDLEPQLAARADACSASASSDNSASGDSSELTMHHTDDGALERVARGAETVLHVRELLDALPADALPADALSEHTELLFAEISSDGRHLLASARLRPADEGMALFVKALGSPLRLVTRHAASCALADTGGGTMLLWAEMDTLTARASRVLGLPLSEQPAQRPVQVLEELDPRFSVDVAMSKDQQVLIVSANSKRTSEVHVLRAGQPLSALRCVREREDGVQYFVEHCGDYLWIVSNRGAVDYSLWRVPLHLATPWERITGEHHIKGVHEQANLEELDVVRDRLVLFERRLRDATQQVRVLDLVGREVACVRPGELGVEAAAEATPEFNARELWLPVSAPDVPDQRLRVPLWPDSEQQHEQELVRLPELQVDRLEVRGVPVTLLRRRGQRPLGGGMPLLVQSYGAYGLSLPTTFEPALALLAREGWAVAWAHLRGGLERGRGWYLSARCARKRATLDDLAAAVQGLHDAGWGAPRTTAARSWSAGAVALGALANERPELVAAMALRAPFLNVLDAMQDAELPLTSAELEEWGDPADPEVREAMLAYDPLRNAGATAGQMPSVLVSCSLADLRVPFWGPLQYVRTLRDLPPPQRPPHLMLRWSEHANHFGDGGGSSQRTEQLLELEFLSRVVLPAVDRPEEGKRARY